MPNQKNIQAVKELSDKVKKSSSLVFFEYKNVSSNVLNDLRRRAKEASAEILVAKNTLMRRAVGDKKVEPDDLQGQTGVLFASGDGISPLKALFDFAGRFPALKIKGALIDSVYYPAQKVAQLSKLPSKAELVARLAGGLTTPIRGFVTVLSGTRGKLVYALSAIAKQKEVDK